MWGVPTWWQRRSPAEYQRSPLQCSHHPPGVDRDRVVSGWIGCGGGSGSPQELTNHTGPRRQLGQLKETIAGDPKASALIDRVKLSLHLMVLLPLLLPLSSPPPLLSLQLATIRKRGTMSHRNVWDMRPAAGGDEQMLC
jgi:hypothetical protein